MLEIGNSRLLLCLNYGEEMKSCFVSTYKGEWMHPAAVLKDRLGYEIVELNGKEYVSISNRWNLLRKELENTYNILRSLKKINYSDVIICPNYVCLFLLLIQKIHVLKVKKICWFGMYLHDPKWIRRLGKLMKLFSPSSNNFRIIVFSKAELKLYAEHWRGVVDFRCFQYVPYGDWNNSLSAPYTQGEGYFFSGGYSNRDYIPLIEAFTGKKEKLLIAASKQNTDLIEWLKKHELSKNILLYLDVDQGYFDELLRGAKAVIFVMKYNTGAAGQMVLLNAMANRKLIIATYTDVLDEYVKNNESALVFNKEEVQTCLQEIIPKVERNINAYQSIVDRAYEIYKTRFSFEALSEALVEEIRKL